MAFIYYVFWFAHLKKKLSNVINHKFAFVLLYAISLYTLMSKTQQ